MTAGGGAALPWRAAMTAALYGEGGFFRRPEGPGRHFRTSVSAAPELLAGAVLRLAERVDEALGRPEVLDLVDVGAGRGELLTAIAAAAPPALAGRLRLTGVEVVDRPRGLPVEIGWTAEVPPVVGLLVANEWLDDVPLDVVQLTADGPRLVLVDGSGAERLGTPPSAEDAAWLARWWPLAEVGDRAEVGRTRDEAWAGAVARVERGLAVAVDYAHRHGDRPPSGTLTGYAAGRVVPPVPDGSCDLTAHVALDSCAAAGEAAGATGTRLTTQRAALLELGVSGRPPPLERARAEPARYLRELSAGSRAAELLDPGGLGGFGWLAQARGVDGRLA